jgi:glycosyltransferase involved in cell wall biosynthesis
MINNDKKTIVLIYNTCHYAYIMRKNLIKQIQKIGYSVVLIAPADEYTDRLIKMGVNVIDCKTDSKTKITTDFILLIRYIMILRTVRPAAVLTFTAKPNIYGSIAGSLLSIFVICNIAGLGTAFIKGGIIKKVLELLYFFGLRGASVVFFQNEDDQSYFTRTGLVDPKKVRLIPGSGVDLAKFKRRKPIPLASRKFTFLFVGRILKDKGIYEFVEAAKLLLSRRSDVKFVIVGKTGDNNPSAVADEVVSTWVRDNIVEFMGHQEDVRPHLLSCDCLVLPSYREGIPRVVLEAGATGRPVIVTNVPGCRQAVVNGQTGLFCEAKNTISLAAAMTEIIDMADDQRLLMGDKAALFVKAEFDERFVLDAYLREITAIDNECPELTNFKESCVGNIKAD